MTRPLTIFLQLIGAYLLFTGYIQAAGPIGTDDGITGSMKFLIGAVLVLVGAYGHRKRKKG